MKVCQKVSLCCQQLWWGVACHPDTVQIPFSALITSVVSTRRVYTIATHSFEISALIISGRVYPERRDCIAIDSSHWGARCGYQLSVSDRSLGLISLTIPITTHNTNQTHVEFCPTNPTPMNCVSFLYIFKHGILLCWTYSHPSENMTNAENHSVNFPLVAFNDPYDQYYIISQTRGGLLRLHNWVFMQNKLYSQSQHYVPWWNVTPLTFKWLERLTDKMLLPLTGDGEGEM